MSQPDLTPAARAEQKVMQPNLWKPTLEGLRSEIIDKFGCRDEAQYAWLTCLLNDALRAVEQATWEEAAQEADKWLAAYPTDVFIEPLAGQHGTTIDACSARMGRHMAKRMGEEFRRRATGGTP